MCEPMQAAVLCAIQYEGWAGDDDAAARLVERQAVRLPHAITGEPLAR